MVTAIGQKWVPVLTEAWYFVLALLPLSRQQHKKGNVPLRGPPFTGSCPVTMPLQCRASLRLTPITLCQPKCIIKKNVTLSLFTLQQTHPAHRAWPKTTLTVIRTLISIRLNSNTPRSTHHNEICLYVFKLAPLIWTESIKYDNAVYQAVSIRAAALLTNRLTEYTVWLSCLTSYCVSGDSQLTDPWNIFCVKLSPYKSGVSQRQA